MNIELFDPHAPTSSKTLLASGFPSVVAENPPSVDEIDIASNSQLPETTTAQSTCLPPHIETAVENSGRTYYINHQTRESSWINPLTINRMTKESESEDRQPQQGAMREDSPLPSHVERKVNPNGRTYYVDHQTKKTSWWNPLHPTDQDGFPNHIERKVDLKGRRYFINQSLVLPSDPPGRKIIHI